MKRLYADLVLLLVAFIWGITFPVIKIALENISPFAFNAIRFSIAAFLFIPFLKLTKKDFSTGFKIGILVFLGYTFQTAGLHYTTATNAGFITSIYVVFTPVIAFIFYRIKVTRMELFSVFLAFTGLYFLSEFNGQFSFGDFLIFLCAIAFAGEIAMISHYSRINDPLSLAFGQVVAVAVFSAPLSFVYTEKINITGGVVIAIFITAVFATTFARIAQNYMQKYTKPSDAAVIFSMEGVFSHIFAVIMLGETLTTTQYFGAVLIVLGVILISLQNEIFEKIRLRSTLIG
jgi:drug/metabolite transporter (DMT)-like permease